MDAGYLIMQASQVLSIVPLIAGAIYFKRLPKEFRVFYLYIIACVLMEFTAAFSVQFLSNNLGLLFYFTLVEMVLLSMVYFLFHNKYRAIRILIMVLMAGFLFAAVWERLYVNGSMAFNNISRPLESFFLVIFTIIYFGLSLTERSTAPIWKQPMFWVSTGILLYFALNIFYFMLFNVIEASGLDNHKLGILHSILNILSYLLYAKAFQCFRTIPKYQLS